MRYLLVMVVVSGLVASASGQSLKDTFYEHLADLTVNRDKVNERFALMVTSERHEVMAARNVARVYPQYRFVARSKEDRFEYYAFCHFTGTGIQDWREILTKGSRAKYRGGSAEKDYVMNALGEPVGTWFGKPNGAIHHKFRPFEIIVDKAYVGHYKPDKDVIATYWLIDNKVKLESVKALAGGDIEAEYKIYCGKQIVTFSAKHGMMPVRNVFECDEKPWHVVMEIQWERHHREKAWLPVRIHAVENLKSDSSEVAMLLDWKLGKDVPDSLFEWEQEDHRLGFEKVFDFEFDRYSELSNPLTGGPDRLIVEEQGTPWKRPKNLFQSEE